MNRSTLLVAFIASFVFAFGATAVLADLSQNPSWVWGLVVCVGFWLWQLPKLVDLDLKLSLICSYAFLFLALWLVSGTVPRGDIKDFVFQMILGMLLIASIISIRGAISMLRKRPGVRPLLPALGILFICCWLIAFFSSSAGAGGHMIDFAMKYLGMSRLTAESAVLITRKCLHFLFYGTVGLLALRAARAGGATQRAAILALLFVLAHASFDEIRQSSFPDRVGSFWDVCLDMSGALVFVGWASLSPKRWAGERSSSTER